MNRLTLALALAGLAALFVPSAVSAAGQESARRARAPEAHALVDRAEGLIGKGRTAEALAALARADARFQQAGDRYGEARVELLRGVVERGHANLDAAETHARRARDLAHDAGLESVEVKALRLLATLAGDRGRPDEAAARLDEALPLARAAGWGSYALILEVAGRNARERGRPEASLDLLARAIDAARRADDAGTQIRAYGARSTTLLGLGRFDEGLENAQQAYTLAQGVANVSLKASAVFGLAQAEGNLGNLERAAELWTEAIGLYREAHLQIGVALATKQRMEVWSALGDMDRAAEDGRTALAMYERTGSAGTMTESLARLALIEVNRGRRDEAAALIARADALVAATPRARRAFTENDLALASLKLGRRDEAAARFTRVLALARESANREYEWRAHFGLGLVALADGRPADAAADLQAARADVETLRRTLPYAAERAAFMRERLEPAGALVEALMAQSHEPGDAFARRALAVAESARGRALSDLLAESRARLTDPRLARVRAEETAAAARLSDVQKVLLTATSDAARDAARARLERAELEFDEFIVRLHRENPAYASLAYPASRSVDGLQAILGPDEAIVEFSIGEDGGYAWVVRRGTVGSYRTPGRAALAERLRLLQGLVGSGDAQALAALGRELYGEILAPAGPALDGVTRLVLVPDGPLLRLPFALLRMPDGRWLVERFVLAEAPSATVFAELRADRSRTGPDALFAVAAPGGGSSVRAAEGLYEPGVLPDTPLAHAAEEAHDVADSLWWASGARRVEPDATEGFVKAASLDRYRIVHFAAHALVDDEVPRRTAIVLEPDEKEDGLLQMNEIANLSLDADLVVLASCRSHVGRLVRGEGFLSLSRTFMYAGARAVVATLWAVDDRDTSRLMRAFYDGLADGQPADVALRAAQVEMLRGGGSGARADRWAAFVVSGDATRSIVVPTRGRRLAEVGGLALGLALGLWLTVVGWKGARSGIPAAAWWRWARRRRRGR